MDYEGREGWLGPGAIIGLVDRNHRAGPAAVPLDVDYLGVGPVFATATKMDAAPPLGVAALQRYARSHARRLWQLEGSAWKTRAGDRFRSRRSRYRFGDLARLMESRATARELRRSIDAALESTGGGVGRSKRAAEFGG